MSQQINDSDGNKKEEALPTENNEDMKAPDMAPNDSISTLDSSIEGGEDKADTDDPNDSTRRSSSRKSKSNAMRLIELQADSGYSGVTQASQEGDKKEDEAEPVSKKRKRGQPSSYAEDSNSDKDDDENR